MAPAREKREFHAIDTFNQPYRPMTFGGPVNYKTDRIGAIWGSWYYNAPKSGRIGITFLSIFILLCLIFLGLTLLAMIYGLIKQSCLFESCCGFRPDHHEQIEIIRKYEEKLAEEQAKKWFKGEDQEEKEPVNEEMDAGVVGEETSRRRVRFANKELQTDGSTEVHGSKETDAELITMANGDRTVVGEREHFSTGSSDGVFVNHATLNEDEGDNTYNSDGRRPAVHQIDFRRARFTPEQQQRLRDAVASQSMNRAARREARNMRDMEREVLATDTADQGEMHQMPPSENLTRLQKVRLRYEKWSQQE